MPATRSHVREIQLFKYVIASADMWYNAIDERTIYLRNDPELGPVIRGEVCGCGPGCHANLSQVLLEYAVSCKGCQDKDKAGGLVECAGERVGRILAARLYQDAPEDHPEAQVAAAFQFILRSMGVPFEVTQTPGLIRYQLAFCPLHETARRNGLVSGIPPARRGFVAICESMLANLAPDWQLTRPDKFTTAAPLLEIILQH